MPTSRADTIIVKNLNEFRTELKALDAGWGKALGQANKRAAQIVSDTAIQNADALGSTARHVASSIKASASASAAQVTLGNAQLPMALGAEFGSRQFHQFPAWRGNQWSEGDGPPAGVGYFMHPAVRDTREEFIDAYDRELRTLAARAFPD